MKRKHLFLAMFLSLVHILAFAQADIPIQIGFDEKQGEYVDLDVSLINEQGERVLMRDLLGKPTILNLVYFNCPGTCSPLMWGIAKFIEQVDLKPGEDYQILTISFDHTESIKMGIQKKANYVTSLKNKELAEGWHFFVSDSANIARLTESVGFNFQWVVNQYSHPTGLIALGPDGKITRYLRGIEFLPFDIKITLIEAASGKIGPSINRLLAICYSYDSTGNQFVFNVTKVAGILIVFFSIVLLGFLFLGKKGTKKAN
ncbi:MAG: SCO family protein [Bacteroidales bacterium]